MTQTEEQVEETYPNWKPFYRDVMIDLETLGTSPGCVITQIGAARFNRETGEITHTFEENININSATKYGLTIDGDTLKFWFHQPKEAQKAILKDPYEITQVLSHLNEFLGKKSILWCHATFDIPVLAEAYRKTDIKPSFHYRSTRDIRTLVDLAEIPKKPKDDTVSSFEGVRHTALDDCKNQVKYCVEAIQKLKNLVKVNLEEPKQ